MNFALSTICLHIIHYFLFYSLLKPDVLLLFTSLESRSVNHSNILKYTPQQSLQRLPSLIIQDNKPEMKKFSTTNSNEFSNVRKNPIPQSLAQEKVNEKN